MSNDDKAGLIVGGLAIFCIVALIGVASAINWYRAGVQSEVYRRSGIEMTQWEIFIGARTPERNINLHQE